MITKEPATVFRVGRRRYLSLKGAIRAEARLMVHAKMVDGRDPDEVPWLEVYSAIDATVADLRRQYRTCIIPNTAEAAFGGDQNG